MDQRGLGAPRAPWRRRVVIAALGLVLAQGSADIALAHKGKLPPDALSLVRQAAALLAQDPKMQGEVKERLDAALKSADTRGVDLVKVKQARDALAAGDVPAARRALAEAIPPGTPAPAVPSVESPPQPRVTPMPGPGAPPKQPSPTPDPMAEMKMAEPLLVRFGGTSAEIGALMLGLALVVVGLVALRGERRP